MKKISLLIMMLITTLLLISCSQKVPEAGSATIKMPAKYDINSQQDPAYLQVSDD